MLPILRVWRPSWSVHFSLGFSTSEALNKGHSKWDNIKGVKGKNDAIRSAKISFMLRKVRTAVKNGGFDPKFNKTLANLQNEYKAASLPIDTMNRFLTKLKAGGGFRFSDSPLKNRFEEKGFIVLEPTLTDGSKTNLDIVEEVGIELDCEEVNTVEDREEGPVVELTVPQGKLPSVESEFTKRGYKVQNSEVRLVPLHRVVISSEEAKVVEKFYELVGEDEDVTQIHDNLEEDS